MDKYYIKYLKYKNKYITLSNKLKQYGGTYNDYRDIMELTNDNFKDKMDINIDSLIDFLKSPDGIDAFDYEEVKYDTIDTYIEENKSNYQKIIDELTLNENNNDKTIFETIFNYYYLYYIISNYIKKTNILIDSDYNNFIEIYNILRNKEKPSEGLFHTIRNKIQITDDINLAQLNFFKCIFDMYYKDEPLVNDSNKKILFLLCLCKYVDYLSLFLNNDSVITYICSNDNYILFANNIYDQLFNSQTYSYDKIKDVDLRLRELIRQLININRKLNILCSFEEYNHILTINNFSELLGLYENNEKNQEINNKIYKLFLAFSGEISYDKIMQLNRDICIIAYNNTVDNLFFNIFTNFIVDNLYCNGNYHHKQNCNFSNIHMFINGNIMTNANKKILCSDVGLNDKQLRERNEYFNEMLYIILQPTDKLIHSGNILNIIGIQYGVFNQDTYYFSDKFIEENNEQILWWLHKYVGQSDYKGGWFTLNQDSSGPARIDKFGYGLKYSIQKSFPLLFIPPIYLNKYNNNKNDYFDTIDAKCRDDYIKDWKWSGSHIFEGVQNWKEKQYSKITRNDENCQAFADTFAQKIINLGFNGYISCDECEVFLNYNFQQEYLDTPPEFYIVKKSEYIDYIFANIEDVISKSDIEKLINDLSKKYNKKIKKIADLNTRSDNNIFNMELEQIIDSNDQYKINQVFKHRILFSELYPDA